MNRRSARLRLATLLLLLLLAPVAAGGKKQESIVRHGEILWVAHGHYADVASQRSPEHAQTEVEWVDRTIDGWLRDFAQAQERYEDEYKQRKRDRDPTADAYRIRFFDRKLQKEILTSIDRERDFAVRRVPPTERILCQLFADIHLVWKVTGLTSQYAGISQWGDTGEFWTLSTCYEKEIATRFTLGHELFHVFMDIYPKSRLQRSINPMATWHWAVEGLCHFHALGANESRWSKCILSTKASIRKKELPGLDRIAMQCPVQRKGALNPYCAWDSASLFLYLHDGRDGKYRHVFYRIVSATLGNDEEIPVDVRTPQLAQMLGADEEGMKAFEADFRAWVMEEFTANEKEIRRLNAEWDACLPQE